jgi:geranylgeranyl pyrophosphate synthase
VHIDFFTDPIDWQRPDLPQAQRRLADISGMIHMASLFHDDVIDGADACRGEASAHLQFGNKMAILAGDYILARASICLARLRNVQVVETMSTIIEHLVRGEVMQLRGSSPQERSSERLIYYLRKNFYKTGSLMANSCKSAALLGDYPPELVDASYRYG